MIKNRYKFKKIDKTILGHHPINAEWLDIKCIATIKPIQSIHLENIKDINEKHRNMSIGDWNNLKDVYQYTSFFDLKIYLEYVC